MASRSYSRGFGDITALPHTADDVIVIRLGWVVSLIEPRRHTGESDSSHLR